MKTLAGTCCFKEEAASSSETMVPFYEIVWLHIPEVSYLHCTFKTDHKLLILDNCEVCLTSLQGPCPQELRPATRNLYAVPVLFINLLCLGEGL